MTATRNLGDVQGAARARLLEASHISLPSERKFVTILFADTDQSTKLIEALDPEEAAERLSPVIRAMVDGIHRYGGTVIRFVGDGVIALFGAPHAYEDHAVRACHAALAMQRSVGDLRDSELSIRVALHSGEIMVRPIVSDVAMDYDVSGVAMHVASRLEKLTKPGTICISHTTFRLVEGLVDAKPLGTFPIKGISSPIELFEITSQPLQAARWDARLARGLTPFLGRDAEWNALRQAMELARAGKGQVIEIGGDIGIGKSRLVHEFTRSEAAAGCMLFITGTASYAKDHPYFSLSSLFRNLFRIERHDDYATVTEKISATLGGDSSLAASIPALRSLLDLPAAGAAWVEADPRERRSQMVSVLRDVVLSFARKTPVILVHEDLQWIDEESRSAIDVLIRGIADAGVLVLLTSRTAEVASLPDHSYYRRVTLQPLEEICARQVLDRVLGSRRELDDLKRALIARAQGNPLFLEEIARMIAESSEPGKGGSRGSDAAHFTIPETIQSVLAARIDRLPAVQKDVLQVASVVGKEVPASVLSNLIALSPAEIEDALAALNEAELLIVARPAPDLEFSFKHALTQEVAYRSLLRERRRKLHSQVCSTIESLYAQRINEHAELLAYHAWFGDLWQEAVSYSRQSGGKAIERSAYREATVFFERALQALDRLPETISNTRLGIDLRLSLRIALGAAGDYRRLYEHLTLAEARSVHIGDEARLGAICTAKTHVLNVLGDIAQAISTGRRACALATSAGDAGQSIASNYFLAQAHEFHGDYADAIKILSEDLPRLRQSFRHSRFGMTGTNSVLHLSLLSHCHAYLAQFAEAEACAREACLIAAETNRPFDVGVAHFGHGIVKICRGAIEDAIHSLERGLQVCGTGEITGLFPMLASRLGFAYALAGRLQEGRTLLDRACTESIDAVHMHGWCLAFSGWVEHRLGAVSNGLAREFQALEVATQNSYRGMQVWILWFLGAMLPSEGEVRTREARDLLERAIGIAEKLGMRLHAAYCYGTLAEVCDRLGQVEEANKASSAAARIRREFDADGCLALPQWSNASTASSSSRLDAESAGVVVQSR